MKELLLTIDVTCGESPSVTGTNHKIVMIHFTGKAHSEYFNGETVGTSVDTQKFDLKDGTCTLSARYMLSGTDKDGTPCRIFIDNSLHDDQGWHPFIVTDSPLLHEWEKIPLIATVDSAAKGVTVKIYRE